MAHRISQPSGLISVLLDASAPFGDRHDAAMDLGEYDAPEAEAALLQVASDLSSDPDIADAAGESLSSIWMRLSKSNPDLVESFHPEARKFFMDMRG